MELSGRLNQVKDAASGRRIGGSGSNELAPRILGLVAVNLVLLALLLTDFVAPAATQTTPGVLRGSAPELVESQGRPRASIKVEPPSTVGGVAYPETVVLRLISPDGRPVVKIASSVDGGGLSVIGDTDQTFAVLNARPTGTTITFLQKDGRRIVVGQ